MSGAAVRSRDNPGMPVSIPAYPAEGVFAENENKCRINVYFLVRGFF